MNRALSIRSKNKSHGGTLESVKHKLVPSLRGSQPELSRRLARLIKTENHVISAYENAGREQTNIAGQLSEWGEETGDETISEIADKLGVLLAEIAEQEDNFAHGLEDSRGVLKQIRNTEASVQPSRDLKIKIQDEIQKLKYKEPTSPKIVQLEQELVRAEAQSLVAEAQLTNITRQKLRQAYDNQLTSLLERSQKQIILAQHARQVLAHLDDTPVVPGEQRAAFGKDEELRGILGSAEENLKAWQPDWQDLPESGALHTSSAGVPVEGHSTAQQSVVDPVEAREQQEALHSGTAAESSITEPDSQHPASSVVLTS